VNLDQLYYWHRGAERPAPVPACQAAYIVCVLLIYRSIQAVSGFHGSGNLSDIFPDWDAWEQGMADMERMIGEYAAFKGTLARGPEQLLKAQLLSDQIGMLLYKVYQFPSLASATDTRDNEVAARLQRIQILYARFQTETAWFSPELLAIDWSTMEGWLNETEELAPYRYGIENLYRQQAHVLDEDKEQLLSYFNRFESTPAATYRELSTSDIDFPDITLSNGDTVTVKVDLHEIRRRRRPPRGVAGRRR